MASVIARMWSLGVLRVTLDETPKDPTVTCEVIINEGPQQKVRLRRVFPIWSFGNIDPIGRSRVRELELTIPRELVADLTAWVRGGADKRAVLWIHLVKPYGVLGAVPWERMETAIGIPVLRIPDVLPDQKPPVRPVNIAVCAAALRRKGDLPIAEVASEIMNAVSSLPEEARVHFFVDQVNGPLIADRLSKLAGHAEWKIHEWDPTLEGDMDSGPERRPRAIARAENCWLAWIQDAARKQSFDVLHFVCHGYVTGQGDHGVLALPVSPAKADFQAASHVTATEVLKVAQTVGAFAVGFSSLLGNYSVSGMRLVADAVGANRAGPVFMYEHAGDVYDLYAAYKLVLGYAHRGRGGVFLGRSLLFYIQPDLVMLDERRARKDFGYGVTLRSPAATDIEAEFPSLTGVVTERGADSQSPPPWVSVLARYVDEKRSELTPLRAAQRAGNLDRDGQAYMEGVENALKHLDSVLTRYAGSTR